MGTDLGVSLSGSSSATSGIGTSRFGDFNVGGLAGLPKWTVPLLIVGIFVVATLFVLRRT
jgi:hypothetical protein